jgi:hypothetical protein
VPRDARGAGLQQREPGLPVLIAASQVKWVKLLADATYVIEGGATVLGGGDELA